ncbi:MAG: hypothetical protein H0W76_22765 [Pyrinomonadaceae bacterium]|nr:hypothetical protein [Pyrinomonadaceae bacterium]
MQEQINDVNTDTVEQPLGLLWLRPPDENTDARNNEVQIAGDCSCSRVCVVLDDGM